MRFFYLYQVVYRNIFIGVFVIKCILNNMSLEKKNISLIIISLVSIVYFTSCKTEKKEINSILSENNPFQTLIDSVVVANNSIEGAILHIESPDLAVSWTGTTGVDEIESRTKLRESQPFRIASITKTYVAAAILRLYEQEKLSLNDTIGKYISDKHLKILKDGGYLTENITIRQLLSHTHGIYDYAMSDNYFSEIIEKPNHIWTRTEQLLGAVQWGSPLGLPGEKFQYSDTGYILLGEILESITGHSLALSLNELIGYQKLGLKSTWMEYMEKKPDGMLEIVHPYYDGKDFYDVHPSIDLYGGGGLVSTASDVSLFFQMLFENKVFEKTSTLDTMLTRTLFPNDYIPPQDYRLGIQKEKVNEFEIYYHSGIWGTLAVYIPDLKSSLVVNFTNGYAPDVLVQSLSIIQELKLKHNQN